MTTCTVCLKDTPRTYWARLFPNDAQCYDCWSKGSADSKVIRQNIAKIIWDLRREDRATARRVLKSLRGRGVPLNLKIKK